VAGVPIMAGMASMGVFEWSLIGVSMVPSVIVTLVGAYVAGWLYREG